jgi:hypothetical protein
MTGGPLAPSNFRPGMIPTDPPGCSILAGEPRQYVQFAADYYEREIDVSDVALVYRHVPLTQALVKRLNPDVDLEAVMEDISEIGYPETT